MMCYVNEPCCATHARQALEASEKELEEATKAYESNPTDNITFTRLHKARRTNYNNQIDYYGTPQGQNQIVGLMNKLERAKKHNTEKYRNMRFLWEVATLNRSRKIQFSREAMQKLRYMKATTQSQEGRIRGKTLIMKKHAIDQSVNKGFDPETILQTYENPVRVYPNGKNYPNQTRVTGNGICLVVAPTSEDSNELYVATVYLDNVTTPPREDQKKDRRGRDYHKRYNHHGSAARIGLRAAK